MNLSSNKIFLFLILVILMTEPHTLIATDRPSAETIQYWVKDAISEDLYMDASEIAVDVSDGIVTLSGTVKNLTMKKYATEEAKKIRGVLGVIDKLTVMPSYRGDEEIARDVRRLAGGARDDTLSVDEVTGGTFTITNLGNYGIDGFTPIINSPEAAILGVGRIAERVTIHDDQIARRKMTVLSLTIDHRLIDGAAGAEFMQSLKELLENPYRLLV